MERTTEFYQPLFNLISDQHNVNLLQTDMDEIISTVKKMLSLEVSGGEKTPTDEEIEHYWKRKNCFGHYLEGLVTGSKWMRDDFKSPSPNVEKTAEEIKAEWDKTCDWLKMKRVDTDGIFNFFMKYIQPSPSLSEERIVEMWSDLEFLYLNKDKYTDERFNIEVISIVQSYLTPKVMSEDEIENLYRDAIINGDFIPNWKDGFKAGLKYSSVPSEKEAVDFLEWRDKYFLFSKENSTYLSNVEYGKDVKFTSKELFAEYKNQLK